MLAELKGYSEVLAALSEYLGLALQAGYSPNIALVPVNGVFNVMADFIPLGEDECISLETIFVTPEIAFRLYETYGIPFFAEPELEDIYGVPT